ncbi:MAG TPA: DUF1761 family protein [Caulobacteraceae bacterium]|nr:DUF1761 family protein [Caulobacteraceae bacterium]
MRINWLGIIISAIVIVALRYLWYAHFGGADWGQLVSKAVGGIQGSQKAAGLELVNALVLSLGIAWVTGLSGRSAAGGLGVGLAAGVLFGLTSAAEGYIHGAPLNDFLVNGGYAVLAYTLAGLIIGASAPRRATRSKFNWNSGEAAAEH